MPSYIVRCIDYISYPDEHDATVAQHKTDDMVNARQIFDGWAEMYQRTDAGRLITIADSDGRLFWEVDQPPCDDET